jgi:hypothetical protein
MDLVKLLLLLLLRPQVALRLIHHRRTEVRPMSEMEEEHLLKEHASELECHHRRGKEGNPRVQRLKMNVR